MTTKQNLLATAGLFFLCAVGSTQAIAQQKKNATPPPATAPATAAPAAPKKEGIKAFAEVITAKAKTKSGLFKTHRLDDKWYFEIPFIV